MAWNYLKADLSLSDTRIESKGGKVIATLTVTGETDDSSPENLFTASLRDDHFIPDILWDSGPRAVGPGERIRRGVGR